MECHKEAGWTYTNTSGAAVMGRVEGDQAGDVVFGGSQYIFPQSPMTVCKVHNQTVDILSKV
jgi:hypothetical protein